MLFDDINDVRLMGNMTNDPELRFTPSGTPVMNFGLATNRSYKKGETWEEETTFHNIVVWGNLAQSLSTRVKKGTRVYIEGRLQVRTWDGNDGKKNYKTEVVASNVILIDRYNKGTNDTSSNIDVDDIASKMQTADKLEEGAGASVDNSIDPDDLPF